MRIGVDEAGKGPVLGPMVAAAVGVPDPGVLPEGVADSKRLTSERREHLATTLREQSDVAVAVAAVSVERIDDPATDMNSLTVDAHARAVDGLDLDAGRADGSSERTGDAPPDRRSDAPAERNDDAPARESGGAVVLADAADTDEDRFARRLAEACRLDGEADDVRVRARHRADEDDPVVAAASIVAKVERDRRVDAIAERFGAVGSGYPGDETTRSFLASYVDDHGTVPPCARASWSTCEDLLAAAEQSGLDDF